MAKATGTKVTVKLTTKADEKKSRKSAKTVKATKVQKERKAPTNPFIKTLFAIGGYFRGAWIELRLVRWPSRSQTWGLTFAVILFSGFFAVVILLLDILFKYIFELILK
jgi:preprotein translocase SecE subunit